MLDFNYTADDISLLFSGPSLTYTVTWTASFVNNHTLKLSFAVDPPIIGSADETLSVGFNDITSFKSINLIPISNPIMFQYEFKKIEITKSAKTTGSGTSITFIMTFILSMGVSLLTGGSMEHMWSLTNTLQILYICGLLRLYYSPNLQQVFKLLEYSNFDNPITNEISKYVFMSISITSYPLNSQFKDLGFVSSSLIMNSLDKLIMIFALAFLTVIVYIFYRYLKNKSNWFARLIKRMDKSLRYESTSRFIIEISMTLCISALINIFYGDLGGALNLVSMILSISILIIMAFMLFYTIYIPLVYFHEIKTHCELVERHCLLFLDFRTKHKKCLLYYSYFIVRRLGIACVVVLFKEYTHLQLVFLTMWFFWMTKYLLIYKPFKSQVSNFLNCINEIFLLIFSLCLYPLKSPENAKRIELFGYI